MLTRFALNSPQATHAAESASPLETTALTGERLHEQYLPAVFRYVARRVPQAQDAEDITAEVFAAAFEGLPRFRGQSSPYAWLLGISRRKIADALRQRSRRRETLATELHDATQDITPFFETLASAAEGPEATTQREEAKRVVRRAVASLPEAQREALLLQYVEELSIAEVAAVMGKSVAAANSLLQRGRAAIYRQARGYFLDEGEPKS